MERPTEHKVAYLPAYLPKYLAVLAACLGVATAGCAGPKPAVQTPQAAQTKPAAQAPPPAQLAAPPATFGKLVPGAHPVGFSQRVLIDRARTYDSPFAPERPDAGRPIVLNIWYPATEASTAAMTVADYLVVPRSPEAPPSLGERLETHLRGVLIREIFEHEEIRGCLATRAWAGP